MANLVRIEPALFRADEAWYIFDDGRRCLRKRERADPSSQSPTIISDYIDPVKSMADGKMYDSKSALFRTYRADGNPQGIAYECVGNEAIHNYTAPKRDKAKSIEAIKRALGDL